MILSSDCSKDGADCLALNADKDNETAGEIRPFLFVMIPGELCAQTSFFNLFY